MILGIKSFFPPQKNDPICQWENDHHRLLRVPAMGGDGCDRSKKVHRNRLNQHIDHSPLVVLIIAPLRGFVSRKGGEIKNTKEKYEI